MPKLVGADQLARVLCLELDENKVGWCPLPEHDGIARIVGHVDWGLAYECDCNQRGWFDRPPSDAFYSLRSGQVLGRDDDRLPKGTRWLWRALLTHMMGLFDPVPVELPELRSSRPPHVVTVRGTFALVLGLRTATGDDGPMPFTQRTVGAWLQISRPEAWRAIRELTKQDVIRVVGQHGRTPLYAPGDKTEAGSGLSRRLDTLRDPLNLPTSR